MWSLEYTRVPKYVSSGEGKAQQKYLAGRRGGAYVALNPKPWYRKYTGQRPALKRHVGPQTLNPIVVVIVAIVVIVTIVIIVIIVMIVMIVIIVYPPNPNPTKGFEVQGPLAQSLSRQSLEPPGWTAWARQGSRKMKV